MVQYCVLYLFCCNVRPLYCRAYAQAYSLCPYSKMQTALAVLPRIPARAHSQAERHCLALSPPRGQGSGRQIYAAEKRPHAVEYDYGGVDRTVPPDLCRRVRHGDLLIFCFLDGRLRTFLHAFRLRNGRREVSPPRIPAPRQVYKSEAGRLYLTLSRTQRHTHQTRLRQCRKKTPVARNRRREKV